MTDSMGDDLINDLLTTAARDRPPALWIENEQVSDLALAYQSRELHPSPLVTLERIIREGRMLLVGIPVRIREFMNIR